MGGGGVLAALPLSARPPPPLSLQFPITAIREIKILKILNHKNIVRLHEIVTSEPSEYNQGKGSIYMVMEFSDHDLTGLTDAGQKFSRAQVKCYMKQMLEGLAYCHAQKVLHRDIKGSNLLINNKGQLKLADFGLARPYDTDQQRPYTNRVITLWYRPPELLLGATMYGPAIDMWSAGCILAELLVRKAILPGKNEFEQIDLIFKLLGTPSEETWPGCSKLQYYDMILAQTRSKYTSRFAEKFGHLDEHAQDLLRKLLAMNPIERISADDALDHEYFWTEPMPATPEQLPKYPPSHEFTAKKRRQAMQQQQNQSGSGAQPTGHGGQGSSSHQPPPPQLPQHIPGQHQGRMSYPGQHGGGGGGHGGGGQYGGSSRGPYPGGQQQRMSYPSHAQPPAGGGAQKRYREDYPQHGGHQYSGHHGGGGAPYGGPPQHHGGPPPGHGPPGHGPPGHGGGGGYGPPPRGGGGPGGGRSWNGR